MSSWPMSPNMNLATHQRLQSSQSLRREQQQLDQFSRTPTTTDTPSHSHSHSHSLSFNSVQPRACAPANSQLSPPHAIKHTLLAPRFAHTPNMDLLSGPTTPPGPKPKIIVVMGATGAGKSRLSLDLAARFPPATFEVINTDKMQLYKGLDVTTNKLSAAERRVVPHHLIGELDSRDGDLTAAEYRRLAAAAVESVVSRGRVPVLVGGSNSFIHALLVDRFEPDVDVFDGEVMTASTELRYECCFLFVDVALPVLTAYLSRRVEEMLDSGMVHELAEFHGLNPPVRTGITNAIGVAEFSRYLKEYPQPLTAETAAEEEGEDAARRGVYEEAVREVKKNTWRLAKRQLGKIARLRKAGWEMKRLDATEAFRAVVTSDDDEEEVEEGGKRWSEIWEREVVEPSVKIVMHFLEEE